MSWFDATGFANLAKSALKEAQKTIDKALDIQEEDGSVPKTPLNSTSDSADNFDSSWSPKESLSSQNSANKLVITTSPTSTSSTQRLTTSTSLWGSFAGSFFENPKITTEGDNSNTIETPSRPIDLISDQPKKSAHRSLSLDLAWSGGEPITTPPRREEEKNVIASDDIDTITNISDNNVELEKQTEDEGASIREEIKNFPPVEVVFRERKARNHINRLSAISSESDRKSSESCEVLGSCTPDSDRTASISTSSSVARLRQSGSFGSVEVLSSPSSVEVLGSNSLATPSEEASNNRYSSESISPVPECEGVEVIPEIMEDEEEISLAEDSYTSASESTLTATVLEYHQQDAIKDLMLKSTSSLDTSFSEAMSPRDCMGSRTSVNLIMTHTTAASQNVEPFSSTDSISNSLTTDNFQKITSSRFSEPRLKDLDTDKLGDKEKELDLSFSSNKSDFIIVSNALTLTSSSQLLSSNDKFDNISSIPSTSVSSDSGIAKTVCNINDSDHVSAPGLSSEIMSSDSDVLPNESSGAVDNFSSSCEEGTIMGSSSDEAAFQASSSTSSYIKNMLADAMCEKNSVSKDQSPLSSERSEQIKLGSSGHTSGDELETATSSDIEIISSPTPNGDSSSAASRHSPSKLVQTLARPRFSSWLMLSNRPALHEDLDAFGSKQKGHNRVPSETSSGGSDDCSEIEKLHKKLSEMSEILEARESKLIDLSRINADLQETNSDLRSQLESQDVSQINEEYMQRLAALERKFQQAIREKELLRKQLEHAKTAAVASEKEADEEKDQVISELREEGEKLSKQQLALNNAIKKLRASEKESRKTISTMKDQLDETNQELERAKKALSAKEDMERMQIEAVHQLTKTNVRLDKELASLQSQLDSLTTTLVTSQRELEDSRLECASLRQQVSEAVHTAEAGVRQKLEDELEAAATQYESLKATLHDLRDKLTQAEKNHLERESGLRLENSNLLRRLEAAELRAEELSESATTATKPLLKQIEALTGSSNSAAALWEKQEKKLNEIISDLQSQLCVTSENEKKTREEYSRLSSRNSNLESKLLASEQEIENFKQKVSYLSTENDSKREENTRLVNELEKIESELKTLQESFKKELVEKEQQLLTTKAALDAEKLQNASLQDTLKNRGVMNLSGIVTSGPAIAGFTPSSPQQASPRSSPTLSFGRAYSISESLVSTAWPNFGDDMFESGSTSGRFGSVYDSFKPGHTTLLEGLQSQLKLRDGEVHQLQWELNKRDIERASLRDEIAALTARSEEQEVQLTALSTQYDALLQMYGEKMEESQELKMDLQDVKDMYKAQIEQLLKKDPNVKS